MAMHPNSIAGNFHVNPLRRPIFGGFSDYSAQTLACVAERVLQIGAHLSEDQYPEVQSGGAVQPGRTVTPFLPGRDENNAKRQTAVPSAPSSSTETRAPNSPGTAGPTSSTASVEFLDLRSRFDGEVLKLQEAYPRTRVFKQDDGMWLSTESAVVDGLERVATFLVGISYNARSIRSWGFWRQHAVGVTWIGPRHTNFPDGSICAFAPHDATWVFDDSLVTLLDLYTVWALRHLHLEWFGVWPGLQFIEPTFERLEELHPSECCGCGSSKQYAECCMPRDATANRLKEIIRSKLSPLTMHPRQPPSTIVSAVLGITLPPPITEIQFC
jgi:hypothetical protein